MIDTFREIEY